MFSHELIWFLVGLALVILEFQLPGVILIFFGVGAWITALTTWFGWTEGLTLQFWVFAVSSVLLLVSLRRFIKGRFHGHESPEQNPDMDLDDFDSRRSIDLGPPPP